MSEGDLYTVGTPHPLLGAQALGPIQGRVDGAIEALQTNLVCLASSMGIAVAAQPQPPLQRCLLAATPAPLPAAQEGLPAESAAACPAAGAGELSGPAPGAASPSQGRADHAADSEDAGESAARSTSAAETGAAASHSSFDSDDEHEVSSHQAPLL